MPSYADIAFNSGEYIPQYAGIPLDQIEKTADTLSTRHYQNIAQANSLQILANQLKSKMLPGAKGYVDQHITALDEALGDMATSGGENATARVNALARALQGDQGILNALQRSEEYNRQTGLIDELKAKGEVPLFNQQRRAQLEQAKATDELYQSPYQSAVEPFRSPTPEMEAVWKTVNPDSYEGAIRAAMNTSTKELLGKDVPGQDPDLPLFFESVTQSGISGPKIKNMLDNAWSTYQNSQSYKQQTGELIGKTPEQVKREFYKQGLLRVYSNIQRDYKPTPAWAGSGSGATPAAEQLIVPMEATVRDTMEKTKSKIPGMVDKALLLSEEKSIRGELAAMSSENKFLNVKVDENKKKKLESRLNEIESEKKRTADDVRKSELETFKTVMEVSGIQPQSTFSIGTKKAAAKTVDNMSDSEIEAFMKTPQGRKAMQEYKDNYLGLRYNNAFVNVPLSKDASETNERFIQKTIQFRPIMSVDGSRVYTNILDENREPQDPEMEMLNRAIFEGKFEYVGTATPRNLFGKMAGSENFVKPIRVRVQDPDDPTKTKDYYLGQPAMATQPTDVNENVLWEAGTSKPGAFNSVGQGYEIMTMPSAAQREKYYPKYGASVDLDGEFTTVDQSKFISNPETVLLKTEGGKVIPFANYTAAANYLAQKGIKLEIK